MQSAFGDEEMDEEEEEGEGDIHQFFEAFRASPQFQQLRMLARTNPAALEQVLQNLPPELLQIISAHQEEFLRLLTEEAPVGSAGGAGAAPGAGGTAQPQAGFAYVAR